VVGWVCLVEEGFLGMEVGSADGLGVVHLKRWWPWGDGLMVAGSGAVRWWWMRAEAGLRCKEDACCSAEVVAMPVSLLTAVVLCAMG
jgi:hypothetical protein